MAQITITIPDDKVAEVVAAFASAYNYTANAAQGETQNQFARRMIAEFVKQIYQKETANQASTSAYNASISSTASTTIE
jgi:hypothetical protein